MVLLNQNEIDEAQKHFEKKKVFSVKELASFLKCSIASARVKLKQWQAHTSYNQNGRFYALPKAVEFDQNGLWRHKDIAFSRHGTIKKTLVQFVVSAPIGLSGNQLGVLLGLNPRSFLHHFRDHPGIRREKHDGVFIYFSDTISIYEKQLEQRRASAREVYKPLRDLEAITILAAIINHHDISAEDILALPEIKEAKIKLGAIQSFMEEHALQKKTPDFMP